MFRLQGLGMIPLNDVNSESGEQVGLTTLLIYVPDFDIRLA
jgi:hypothetical protein